MSDTMSKVFLWLFCFVWLSTGFLFLYTAPRHDTVRIDCSIAEISPDIPVEAKEQCRKLKSGRI